VTLTFDPQIYFLILLLSSAVLIPLPYIKSFHGSTYYFEKIGERDGLTDWRTDGVQHSMRPPGERGPHFTMLAAVTAVRGQT